MNIKVLEIKRAFGGRLVGNDQMKNIVCETISFLPEDLINYLTKYCWFLSSSPDAWAYTFHGNDIPDKYLILLTDELFNEPLPQIKYTILHEIGHVIFKHKNSIGFKQTKQQIKAQEKQADSFAKKYLAN